MDRRSEQILHNLSTYALEHGVAVDDVVGLKLRATYDMRRDSTHYLGGDIYDPLFRKFRMTLMRESRYLGQRLHDVRGVAVVEHESGPEFLAAIAAFGNAASPFLSVIEVATLVGGAAMWLRRKLRPSEGRTGPAAGSRRVSYVRVEKRERAADGSLSDKIVISLDISGSEAEEDVIRAVERSLAEERGRQRPRIRRGSDGL